MPLTSSAGFGSSTATADAAAAAALHRDAGLRRIVRQHAHLARAQRRIVLDAIDQRRAARGGRELVLHRDDAGLGADDVIERFERFAVGEFVDLGFRVEPFFQAGESVGRSD